MISATSAGRSRPSTSLESADGGAELVQVDRLDDGHPRHDGDGSSRGARTSRPRAWPGSPAIARIPCGFTRDGLPVGLQLLTRPFDEATLLRAAYAYEHDTDWSRRRPSL
jgi:aspartyl-tRNA(Asn)/glutamyl-tRNA(Gln) amidotransferase subunit A